MEDLALEESVIKRLKLIWADGSYRGELITRIEDLFGWKLEIMEKPKEQKVFKLFLNGGLWNEPLLGWFVKGA